jgi:hypothetical protein
VAKKTPNEAFDLKKPKSPQWKTWDDLAGWLAGELDQAISGRGAAQDDIRYAWDYYEQNRMRGRNSPWPDAADLPSPLAPEYVDAVHARLMQTVFVEPVWTVEGYGESAKRAPFVEEFHQRAQEDERLQQYADEWILRGLVEGVGTMEVSEAYEMRRTVQRRRVALQIDPITQKPISGEDGQPVLARHPETDDLLDAEDETTPSAEVDVDQDEPVRLGPEYDVIPYLDFGVLPGHARTSKQVWGYWKRFFRRVPELEEAVERGVYAKDAIERVGTADEQRAGESAPSTPTPLPQSGVTAQKELFECPLLLNLDGKGARWWRITIHKETRTILRAKMDDRTTRYIRWMPFPKPGSVDRGYSLVMNKLITVIEEDTARRNMTADRMALKIGTPVKRLQGALWDPTEQPWSPRAVLDVRNMDEVQPMQGIDDVPQSVMLWRQHIRDDADRLIGQNDVAMGADTEERRTATEVTTRAGYAEVRMNIIVKRMQESLEELGQARHTIWKRALSANPNLPMQRAMVIGRDVPGIEADAYPEDNTITAQMLDGTFWFKPRGSVETADLNRQRADFNSFLQTLPALMQMNPAVAMVMSTIPAAKSLMEHALKVNRVPDRQSFLGSEATNVFDVMQQQQEQAQMQQQMLQDPRMQIMQAALGGGQAPALPMGGQPQQPQQPPMGGGMVQ